MSTLSRDITYKTILLNGAANGVGAAIDCRDWRHATLAIIPNNATLTVKCQGSRNDTPPTFGSAASPTNEWAYISTYSYTTADLVSGATGVVLSASSTPSLYTVNFDGLTFLNFEVSGYSAGSVTIKITLFNNQ